MPQYAGHLGPYYAYAGHNITHSKAGVEGPFGARADARANLPTEVPGKGTWWSLFRQTTGKGGTKRRGSMPRGGKSYNGRKRSRSASVKRRYKKVTFKKPRRGVRAFTKAFKKPLGKNTLSLLPRKIGREWPPEKARVKLETKTVFTMTGFANSKVDWAHFRVGTHADLTDMVVHAGDLDTGQVLRRTAALPRSWTIWSAQYNDYARISVKHYVKLWCGTSDDENDFYVVIVKDSSDNTTFLNVVGSIPSINAIGMAEPYADANRYSDVLLTYRNKRQFHLQNYGSGKGNQVSVTERPYMYKDRFGQKVTGGINKDDSSGVGEAIKLPITNTNTAVGLCGHSHFFLVHKDRGRGVGFGNVTVQITTVQDIIFSNRKTNIAVQGALSTAFSGPF